MAAPNTQREDDFFDDEVMDCASCSPSAATGLPMQDIQDARDLPIPPVGLPMDFPVPDAAPPVLEAQDVPLPCFLPVGLPKDLSDATPPVLGVQDVPMQDIRDTPHTLIPPVGLPMDSPAPASPVLEAQNVPSHDIQDARSPSAPAQDVINRHPPTPDVQPPLQSHSIEDLIYYRYGYCLNETPYQGPSPAFASAPNHFKHWVALCNAVDGKGLSASEGGHAPITDFFVALLASQEPLRDVPGKYWDLSPENTGPLTSFSPIHLRITIKEFRDRTLCLLHSLSGLSSMADWCIAVEPMIALECIRHALGPSLIDVAQFLLDEGIPFHTLTPSSNLPRRIQTSTSS